MKIVIPGGSGHIGKSLVQYFQPQGHEIVLLSRSAGKHDGARVVAWDGVNQGPWVEEVDGADAIINLAGRTVNCRYNAENLWQMMDSRVKSTRAVGLAIQSVKTPPRVWLQSSTATIYADSLDHRNSEADGILGEGGPEDMPPRPGSTKSSWQVVDKWRASQAIARAWEARMYEAITPMTRKVALRSSMVMSAVNGSVFDVMSRLAKCRLGGTVGTGRQYVSWIHELDFARALDYLISREDIEGSINVCSPNPVRNREFNQTLRKAVGVSVGLPLPAPILEFGAVLMKTETELLLKSRCVVPGRLLDAGFRFEFADWTTAAAELSSRRF